MNFQFLKRLVDKIESDYINEAKNNEATRWLQDFNKEIEEVKQYREREILELLQNADDAGSSRVDITLDTSNLLLTITNSGQGTIPFTEEGVKSIMYANVSPKKGLELIGAKGLGFRSVLNWADHITIISDNIEINFSPERLDEFWNKSMNLQLSDRAKYEAFAHNDHRRVPLALLALPSIREISVAAHSTSIKLHYLPEREDHIKKDLKRFVPTCLLFLHNIKQITIEIDGITIANHQNSVISVHDGIQISELTGGKWIMKRSEGKEIIDGVEKRYEAGCAYCINPDYYRTYPIYDFFPTNQDFGLPCVLHATVNLNSSRTELIQQDPTNKLMMRKLADVVSDVAEYLKKLGDTSTWDAYRLMRPNHSPFESKDSYKSILFKLLHDHKGAYIPLTGEGYATDEGCFYLNDNLYDVISSDAAGISIFADMRKKTETAIRISAGVGKFSPTIRNKIEDFARAIDNYDFLARYILALRQYGNESGINMECHVFKDSERKIIKGRAYINEGQQMEDIPSFLTFEYMGQQLVEALKKRMVFTEYKTWQREMADKLSLVGEVSSSDITSITNLLVPKSKDSQRPKKEWHELLISLFKIFLNRGDKFSIGEKTEAWLPTERADQWQRASMLIMADTRFPDGFKNLEVASFSYPPERCVAYPDYLDEIAGDNPLLIQEFFIKLGVNLYFSKGRKHYGEDSGYINSLDLPLEVRKNCSWKDQSYDSRNTAEIADMDVLCLLRIPDLLKVIKVSGYDNDVCGEQKIHWFDRTYKTPVQVELSYAAYLLRNNSMASNLRFYAVEDGEWLPGMMPHGVSSFDNSQSTQRLLYSLGAVRQWSDFSAAALYEALQKRTNESEKINDPTGIKTFYHKIKMALNEKAQAAPPATLRLACKKDDKLCFLPAKEIYYSDNAGVRSLRRKLPMLEMSSREGEDIVKRVFGCRLFKDIRIEQQDAEENKPLSSFINRKLQTLKPYILAFASKSRGIKGGNMDEQLREIAGMLDRLSIHVVSRAHYIIKDEGLMIDEEIEMENGDLQYFGRKPTLHSSLIKETDALSDPYFCNGVVEAIGIALKLKGADNMDRFHRLLKASQKELEYIAYTEYDESVWIRCLEITGMSESELSFWRHVFEEAGVADKFDEDLLKVQRREYIAEILNIPVDLADVKSFTLHHYQKLINIRRHLECAYLNRIHRLLNEKGEDAQATFTTYRDEFCNEEWIKILHKQIEYQIKPDYDAIVRGYVANRFDFDADNNTLISTTVPPPRHDEYLLGHDFYELNLCPKDESLLFFDGKEDYFLKLINDLFPKHEENDELHESGASDEVQESDPIIIILETIETTADGKASGKKFAPASHSGKREPSDKHKKRAGQRAEDLVLKALKASDEYDVGMIYSEYLAPKEGQLGNNSKGYDLEYRRKGEPIYRCLEIKNCPSGSEIILSANEYEVSQDSEYRDRYDIALVSGNRVMIWENALKEPTAYTLIPEGYIVKFKIKTDS